MQPSTYDYSFSEKLQIERYRAEAHRDNKIALLRQTGQEKRPETAFLKSLKMLFRRAKRLSY